MHLFPDAAPEEAQTMMDDVRRGQMLRWAADNLPLTLAVTGGVLHAFSRSTGAPMPSAQRREIVASARRGAARPAGGAR